jgi:ergothioneine biosynthesis protein EgtB
VREATLKLVEPLTPEDCVLQTSPDVSPTKWHLAHTTWFFEAFALAGMDPQYKWYDERFHYLFNSYYNSLGDRIARPHRGQISRPSLAEVIEYRRRIDALMIERLSGSPESPEFARIVEIGLHHEQQHQELILTDIKHVLSVNPLAPAYRDNLRALWESQCHGIDTDVPPMGWMTHAAGVYEIGCDPGDGGIADGGVAGGGTAERGFAYDNESPKHKVYLRGFAVADRLVTCGEYLQFIEDGGYERSEMWLSDGWDAVRREGWTGPLYWRVLDGRRRVFTLGGMCDVDPGEPVSHVSYYEADAYARWAGSRLLTEFEWEIAVRCELEGGDSAVRGGHFVEHDRLRPAAGGVFGPSTQFFGDCWEWTSSAYAAYPGFSAPQGALGEYNAKFMCNQMTLRGGSCATPLTHIRPTYRNFFHADARWQITGIRLGRDA